jgi:predicted TIM-barrel fold metal-dependent hydrolase
MKPPTKSRRDFIESLMALGATSLVAGCGAPTAESPVDTVVETPAGPPRRIDVHQHFVSPDYHAFLTGMNANTPVPGLFAWNGYTPERNIENMDEAGIETAMLSLTAPGVYFGTNEQARAFARELNEYAAERMVGDYPGRFGLFATLPIPDVDGSLAEIEYAFDTLGADGVGLFTSYGDTWLGDAVLDPIFDELNRRQAVVYTHPIEAACCLNPIAGVAPQTLEYPTDTTRAIMRLITSETATRCPDIDFIFSHAGGTLVSIAGRFLQAQVSANNIDTTPEVDSRLHHVRRFYYDTAGSANPVQLQSLRLLVPDSQIVFGTDFPFVGTSPTVAGIDASGFTADQLQAIYRDNALRMLPRLA